MKLLYHIPTEEIFVVSYDNDWFPEKFSIDGSGDRWSLNSRGEINIHLPLALYEIDEIDPVSRLLCADIIANHKKIDINGEQKYSVATTGLQEVVGWEEYQARPY